MTAPVLAAADLLAAGYVPTRPRRRPGTINPRAGQLHRIAALIAEDDLPAEQISLIGSDAGTVGVQCAGQGDVRRWAQTLGLVVNAAPAQMPDGTAATEFCCAGFRDGVFFAVRALVGVRAVTP